MLFASALLTAAPSFAQESPEALQEAFMAALRAGDASMPLPASGE